MDNHQNPYSFTFDHDHKELNGNPPDGSFSGADVSSDTLPRQNFGDIEPGGVSPVQPESMAGNPYQQSQVQPVSTAQNPYQQYNSQQVRYQQTPDRQNTYWQNNYQQNPYSNTPQNPYVSGANQNQIPEEPVSVLDWVGTILLSVVPCVGLIMYIIWGFSADTKKSKANYCKASLLIMLIVAAVYILFFVLVMGSMIFYY